MIPSATHPITAPAGLTSNLPVKACLSRKRSRDRNQEVNETDAKCKEVRRVQIDKNVKSMEYNTQLQDTLPPVILRMPSTQSSQASTLLDEHIQPEEKPAKKIKKSRGVASTADSIQDSVSKIGTPVNPVKKKKRTYPKPVKLTLVKKTQWTDPLEGDKNRLRQILSEIFMNQRAKDNFYAIDNRTKKNIYDIIKMVTNQLMEYLKDPAKREEFLNPETKDFENSLKKCINDYTREEGLDAETYREAHPKWEQPRFLDKTRIYTYEMIRETEREQILNSIPLFLSHTIVKEHLGKLCQRFQAES